VLAPLVEVVRRYVLKAGKLHGDDIPVPVLARLNSCPPETLQTKRDRPQ
jgi:hypothetical protein